MSKELQKLIREAFNNALKAHSNRILSEALTQSVSQALNRVISNPETASSFAWTPQGSKNKALNPTEFNTFTDELYKMLSPKKDPANLQKLKQIMLALYSPDNLALSNSAAQELLSKKIVPNKEMFKDAFYDGWSKIFLGDVETKSSKLNRHLDQNAQPEFYKNFEQYVAEYNPALSANFGSYIAQKVKEAVLQSYKDTMEETLPKSSLDAPSRTTGKPTDVGDGEDFGSDAMHAGGVEAELGDLNYGYEKTGGEGNDVSGQNVNLDADITVGDTEEVDPETGETLGAELGDATEDAVDLSDNPTNTKQFSKEMIELLFNSINKGIDYYIKQFPNDKTSTAINGFSALRKIMNAEDLNKLEDQAIKDIKKGNSSTAKRLIPIIDYFLSKDDFEDLNGKFMSFQDLSIKNMIRAAKFLKTGEYERVTADDVADRQSRQSEFEKAQARNKEMSDIEDELQNTSRGLKDMMKTIAGIKKTAKSISPEGENATGLQVLSGLLSGISPQTISRNMGINAEEEINKLKADPNFQMFSNLTAQDIADAAKSIKVGKPSKAVALSPEEELQENRLWLIHSLLREEEELERFIANNITTIMENVYNRLSKLL